MLTRAFASGSSTEAKTPVMVKGNGPSSLKQRHPFSDFTLPGTYLLSHTIESSSSVRVVENTAPRAAQCGIDESAASRHTENCWGSTRIVKRCDCMRCRSIQGVKYLRGKKSLLDVLSPARYHRRHRASTLVGPLRYHSCCDDQLVGGISQRVVQLITCGRSSPGTSPSLPPAGMTPRRNSAPTPASARR